MKITDLFYKFNFVAEHRRNKMRKKIENKNVSFLCPNCIDGILFHDLGLKFLSPTVNLMMTQTDFVKYVKHLEAYNKGNLVFFNHKDFTCPCAKLCAQDLDDLVVHFTHYSTPEEALNKWNERKSRINFDNIFVFLEERDGLTYEELESLSALNVRGLVVFTAHKYDLPYTVYIPKYADSGEVGNILRKNHLTEAREYESFFDFVSWFNNANGGNYDVSEYVKK